MITNADRVRGIVDVVTKYYNLDLAAISGKGRSKNRSHSWCKHVCMFFMNQRTSLTLNEIAWYFGNMGHKSTVHALQEVKEVCRTNSWIREDIRQLGEIIDLEIFCLQVN